MLVVRVKRWFGKSHWFPTTVTYLRSYAQLLFHCGIYSVIYMQIIRNGRLIVNTFGISDMITCSLVCFFLIPLPLLRFWRFDRGVRIVRGSILKIFWIYDRCFTLLCFFAIRFSLSVTHTTLLFFLMRFVWFVLN